jgi:hypothetical protein
LILLLGESVFYLSECGEVEVGVSLFRKFEISVVILLKDLLIFIVLLNEVFD